MSNKTDLYYVHLFNDFSGSPRVFRDAIESKTHCTGSSFIFTSNHRGFLDGLDGHRVNCFYARSGHRYIQLFYYLLSQVLLFVQLSSYLIFSRLRGRNITVIVNTMLPFAALLAGKVTGAKVVSYVHETHIKPELLKTFLRLFIEHCSDHVVFVSKYLQSVELFSKPTQDVIYNGLRSDFTPVDEIDAKLKFTEKKLFFAGSLKEYKGIEQLIIIAEGLPDFQVLAALNCTDRELNDFVRDRHLPDNIKFLVRPANIQELFDVSFAVLNLSLPDKWIETFGLSLIEGMACGSPVVSPPVGGPTEFVNKNNGFLIDSRCTAEIIKFIRYLDSSMNVWNEFSNHALLTSKKFTNSEYKKSFQLYFEKYDLG
ncbi:glycosyltransferase family 4 protein [Vibrio coralliilyticus]|uniref:glycosyltransferase family 4 protein n=1 Tax=Vibrio coralliilyticus TaxID=190893 RepID=UPI00155FDD75|nr:glycosyltransferase family 4 protein [Vibrio coralliilyticus]NRF27187.1 glycosyltransferase family 4 protein [Vibrio coralliilyticus]NRF81457.1 glycosyltransferase family 4 protein [Vibrio coralliilyticus]